MSVRKKYRPLTSETPCVQCRNFGSIPYKVGPYAPMTGCKKIGFRFHFHHKYSWWSSTNQKCRIFAPFKGRDPASDYCGECEFLNMYESSSATCTRYDLGGISYDGERALDFWKHPSCRKDLNLPKRTFSEK